MGILCEIEPSVQALTLFGLWNLLSVGYERRKLTMKPFRKHVAIAVGGGIKGVIGITEATE